MTRYVTNDGDWLHVVSLLPRDLDESCRAKLAIERFREIRSAADLLRLYLAYPGYFTSGSVRGLYSG